MEIDKYILDTISLLQKQVEEQENRLTEQEQRIAALESKIRALQTRQRCNVVSRQ